MATETLADVLLFVVSFLCPNRIDEVVKPPCHMSTSTPRIEVSGSRGMSGYQGTSMASNQEKESLQAAEFQTTGGGVRASFSSGNATKSQKVLRIFL